MKTICTTNCAWSGTVRWCRRSSSTSASGRPGRRHKAPWDLTFPTPEAMAAADLDFYKDVVRAGYRGAYLQSLAQSVASGELDLEASVARRAKSCRTTSWRRASPSRRRPRVRPRT